MRIVVLPAFIVVSVLLTACGGGDGSSTVTSAHSSGTKKAEPKGEKEVLELETDPSGKLAYTISEVLVQEGKVTIHFTNPQRLAHDVAIEDSNGDVIGKTELIAKGKASTTVHVAPGVYHFFCTVPGHREAGMEGTISVETL